MVSVSERGLGPGRPDIRSNCLGGKVGRTGHTHVSYLTVWVCLSCMTAEGKKHLIFLCVVLFFSLLSLSILSSLPLDLSFWSYLSSPSSFSCFYLSVPPCHPWPTCGFIGQQSADFRSILFNSLPRGLGKMSSLLQLSSQKYSKLLPAVCCADGQQECNL